jgi:hypothetical protein
MQTTLLFCILLAAAASAHQKHLLQNVQTLTLTRGAVTTARRTSPIPQLECTGGCHLFTPSTIQCHNQGTDGHDVQWACQTELPNNVLFDQTEVNCEGFAHPDDVYVTVGSCGLRYSLRSAVVAVAYTKQLLTSAQTLTLTQGAMTTSRRTAPIRQLECTGGCDIFTPSTIQCRNQGTDGQDVQWACQAELPANVLFAHTEINCEGFDHPNDLYVTVGSCGLEYSLRLLPLATASTTTTLPTDLHSAVDFAIAGVTLIAVFAVLGCGILLCVQVIQSCCDAIWMDAPRHHHHHHNVAAPGYVQPPIVHHTTVHHDAPGFWTGAAVGYVAGSSSANHTTHVNERPTSTVVATPAHAVIPAIRTATGYAKTKRR